MDGGAWWAAVYGGAQSQTRLKRLKQQQQQQRTRILERELAFQKVNYLYPVFTETKYFISRSAAAKSRQSCLTLCDLIDGSLPGSAVPGIL